MSSKGWDRYKLGDVIDIRHGYAFKGEYFSDEPTNNILLTPGNFSIGGGFKSNKYKYYEGDIPETYVLNAGDVIVTMTDLSREGDTLGYSAQVPVDDSVRFLHNQRLGLVHFKNSDLDKRFIYWILRTNSYHTFIVNSASGSTVKHTSPSRIQEYEFEAPDLPTQLRIASILSALDEKIELNNQINATFEAIAQTIFKEWFVDFNFPGSTGEMVESELGMIPHGWHVEDIGAIVDVKGGTTPTTKEESYWNGQNYWVTPKDLSNLKSPILLSTDRKITDEGVKQISSGILPPGTLLLSSRAPIGYLAISDIPVSINQGFIAINANETSNLFILHWLKDNMDTVISRANGSTFLEISKTNFRDIELVIPDAQTIQAFDFNIAPLFEQIKLNEQESTTLSNLRDSLLPKLMNGAIEV